MQSILSTMVNKNDRGANQARDVLTVPDSALKVGIFGTILILHYGRFVVPSNQFWNRIGKLSNLRLFFLAAYAGPDGIDLVKGELVTGGDSWRQRVANGVLAICDFATLLLFLEVMQVTSLGPYSGMVDRLCLATWAIGNGLEVAENANPKKRVSWQQQVYKWAALGFAGSSLVWSSYSFPVSLLGFGSGVAGLIYIFSRPKPHSHSS
jgi:hypothetical protein